MALTLTPATAFTTNKCYVYSVRATTHQAKTLLLASGSCGRLDIFDFDGLLSGDSQRTCSRCPRLQRGRAAAESNRAGPARSVTLEGYNFPIIVLTDDYVFAAK